MQLNRHAMIRDRWQVRRVIGETPNFCAAEAIPVERNHPWTTTYKCSLIVYRGRDK
jgi:hypothetical protein